MAGPATTRAKKMEGLSPPATSASPITKMLNSFGFTPRQMFGQVAAVGAFLHFCLLVCVRAFARARGWDVHNIHKERASERAREIVIPLVSMMGSRFYDAAVARIISVAAGAPPECPRCGCTAD